MKTCFFKQNLTTPTCFFSKFHKNEKSLQPNVQYFTFLVICTLLGTISACCLAYFA